jgi:hypothetical protein
MENRRSIMRISKALMSLALPLFVACSSAPDSNEPESITGTLVKSIGRNTDGSTRVDYQLKSNKQWIRLVGAPAVLESREPNTRVIVKGRLSENGEQLAVEALLDESAGAKGDTVAQVSEALSSTAPKGKVAIFLVKDRSFSQDPYPVQDVHDAILGNGPRSTKSFFAENSYGAFNLTGDIFGWYEADVTTCDQYSPYLVASQIQQQAAAEDGFVTDDYRHAITLFAPSGAPCFIAQGTFGAPDGIGESWSYYNSSNAMEHELGHNLGLHHANSYSCKDPSFQFVPYSSNCESQEYNDPFDGMGYEGFYYQWNSYSKSLQGWLPPERQQRVTTGGTYTITPIETAVPNSIQSLVIETPIPGELLHVEMRRQYGAFDTEPRFDGAVLVRRVREPGLYNYTHLLDMSADGDISNPSLSVGQVYDDPMYGISIGLVSRSATQSVVSVSFGGASCGDEIQNGTETGVDCGGLCSPCSGTCTAQTAVDLGPRSTATSVPSNACVKVSQFPSWWAFTDGSVTVQSGLGSFPVSATYSNACNGAQGAFTFNNAWQSQPIGNYLTGFEAVIQLDGDGSPLQLTWW